MPKLLIRKEKKEFVPELNREVCIVKARQYFVGDETKPVNTRDGIVAVSELKKSSGSKVFTESSNKELFLLDTENFPRQFL